MTNRSLSQHTQELNSWGSEVQKKTQYFINKDRLKTLRNIISWGITRQVDIARATGWDKATVSRMMKEVQA